ncbi:8-oxo-dGTP diphosphatase [Kutzneria viridogrisea]|uniref:8-oxo-dGTP diphosphatase n=2 Tax=Kutzneria viridogrisea TaxID=47990 RepID=A0ABR6BJJ0_9PSEU|nr:8-oxo-dGTP diphosphatase [Kutzneria viridogrisea]
MTSASGPRVAVYALTGRDDEYYLTLPAPHGYTFPGGPVGSGEPVEDALRRLLHDQLGLGVQQADFCAVLEHRVDGGVGVVFVFDVTLTDIDALPAHVARVARWVDGYSVHRVEVHPFCLREAIAEGTFADRTWVPAPPQ